MSTKSLLILLSILPFTMAEAGAYRWVDDQGNTVYSQTPPPTGVESAEIKPPPPPPTTKEEPAAKEETPKAEKGAGAKKDAKKEKETAAKSKEAKELREKNCEAAKKNLGVVKNSRFKQIRAPDGTTTKLDDETRDAMTKEAEQDVKNYCD